VIGLGQLTAVHDLDLASGLAAGATERLNLAHQLHVVGHAAEHDVLAVQPGAGHGGDEELRLKHRRIDPLSYVGTLL
jgi:hypothetical protein